MDGDAVASQGAEKRGDDRNAQRVCQHLGEQWAIKQCAIGGQGETVRVNALPRDDAQRVQEKDEQKQAGGRQ
ncbi:hypothetical protein D3C72_2149600 [compost metagenome]